MFKIDLSKIFSLETLRWVSSRVAVIYVLVLIFCLTCVDLKTLEMRIKTRHLNDNIPDFSGMLAFYKDQNTNKNLNWKPYKRYFELILRYIPDDVQTRQLLGYVEYYSGHEQKAIDLFKGSAVVSGQNLFLSNYNLGVIYYKKGMWQQAAEALFKAVTSNPKVTLLLMQNSIVYKQIFVSNLFTYSLVDEINTGQSKAYILLLSSLNNMGMYEKMFALANLAIDQPNLPNKAAYYFYAAIACLELHQVEKAFMFFEKSLSLEKDNPEVYYYLANIYQNAHQAQQAHEFLQVSYVLHQKNDPRFPYDAQTNLRFF